MSPLDILLHTMERLEAQGNEEAKIAISMYYKAESMATSRDEQVEMCQLVLSDLSNALISNQTWCSSTDDYIHYASKRVAKILGSL